MNKNNKKSNRKNKKIKIKDSYKCNFYLLFKKNNDI